MSFDILFASNEDLVRRAAEEYPARYDAVEKAFPSAEWESSLPLVQETVEVAAGEYRIGIQEPHIETLMQIGAAVMPYALLSTRAPALDRPWTSTRLERFRIGRFPLTNLQVHQFVRETEYMPVGPWILFYNDPLHPAAGLAKQDAAEYCQWANCRIANEDEWEIAARGPDGAIWPWGNDAVPDKCNCKESNIGQLTRVDHFSIRSPLGVCDSSGNVWEMTSSPFAASRGVTSHVMKGGAFSTLLGCCRSSFRIGPDAGTKWDRVGVRCVALETPPTTTVKSEESTGAHSVRPGATRVDDAAKARLQVTNRLGSHIDRGFQLLQSGDYKRCAEEFTLAIRLYDEADWESPRLDHLAGLAHFNLGLTRFSQFQKTPTMDETGCELCEDALRHFQRAMYIGDVDPNEEPFEKDAQRWATDMAEVARFIRCIVQGQRAMEQTQSMNKTFVDAALANFREALKIIDRSSATNGVGRWFQLESIRETVQSKIDALVRIRRLL